MNVASLENSKKLYELSGWTDTSGQHQHMGEIPIRVGKNRYDTPDVYGYIPAYDLGYLLRKLPQRIQDENGNYFSLMGYPNGIQPWFAYKGGLDGKDSRWPIDKGISFHKRVFQADTPENALTLLAIELFEQGILTAPSPDKEDV